MGRERLMKKTVPLVALKPSTATVVESNIYVVRDTLFLPTKENVRELIEFLNTFSVGTVTGNETVDPKYPSGTPPIQQETMTIAEVEKIAREFPTNVLGATFIRYLEIYGVAFHRKHLRAWVSNDDKQFFEVVYPIFEGYFEQPRTVNPDLLPYLSGVVANNTGLYRLLHVRNRRGNERIVMTQIAYLKRVFRYAVSSIVPFPEGIIKDNLVHSPESQKELYAHSELFFERLID